MRGSTVRLAIAAGGTLVVLLLGTSIVDAMPVRPNTKHSRATVCGKLPEVRASARASEDHPFSRKVHLPTRMLVHRHVMAQLQRDRVKQLVDDDEAISSAVSGHDTFLVLGTLEPMGMLAVPVCQPTSHRSVLRRSPRGPPTSPVLA
jgi:hypothetical protein